MSDMQRLLSILMGSFALACGPAVKTAGHSLAAEDTSAKVGSSRPQASPHGDSSPRATGAFASPEPPAASVAEQPLYADVPKGGRLVGKAGPVALEGMGRGGHWIVHCSLPAGAKVGGRGEALAEPSLHLTVADRTEPIAALLGSDEQGRYLVVLINGRAWLIDAVSEKRYDLSSLSPDLRHDRLADHRSFAFTATGLVLLQSESGSQGLFLPFAGLLDDTQDLKEQALSIEFGKRPVWRLKAARRSFSAITLPEGSSEESWPVPLATKPVHRCRAPSGTYDAYERLSAYRPDASLKHSWALAPTASSKVSSIVTTEAPGFVAPFESGWVRREDSGRLVLVQGTTQKQIASARCGARVLRADVKSGFFLIACEEYSPLPPKPSTSRDKPKYRFDLYLIRPGTVRSLSADIARTGVDHFGPDEQRLFPLRPGAQAALVDFNARRIIELGGDVQVLATGDAGAILRRNNQLTFWTRGKEEPLDIQVKALDEVVSELGAAAVGSTMFVVDEDHRSWTLPAPPLAITSQGYAVIPKKAPTKGSWPEGPLLLLGAPAEQPEPGAAVAEAKH